MFASVPPLSAVLVVVEPDAGRAITTSTVDLARRLGHAPPHLTSNRLRIAFHDADAALVAADQLARRARRAGRRLAMGLHDGPVGFAPPEGPTGVAAFVADRLASSAAPGELLATGTSIEGAPSAAARSTRAPFTTVVPHLDGRFRVHRIGLDASAPRCRDRHAIVRPIANSTPQAS